MMDRPLIGITTDFDGERFYLKPGYVEAVAQAGGVPVLIPAVLENIPEYSGIIDGLLIPGGDDIDPSYYGESQLFELRPASRQRTDFEIRLFREIIKTGKPVLGICYGMQLINVALGGSLYQDIEAQFGQGALNHRKEHEIDMSGGPLINRTGGRASLGQGRHMVNSSHHQAVKALGSGLDAGAVSDDGVVEALYMKDYRFLLGVEWHPERLGDKLSDEIFSLFIKAANARK